MTEEPKEPIDAIKNWQKQFRVIAQIDEPGETKDSREKLHDTKKTFESIGTAEIVTTAEKRTFEGFADVIAEALCDLDAAQTYVLFLKALEDNLSYTKKEYLKSLALYQLATGKATKENNG